MTTVYTIGYQPVEIVNRAFKLVDLQNQIIDRGVPSGNLKKEIVEYLKTFTLPDEDYLFVNTVRNRDIIPYCHFANTLVYDPPYVASDREIFKILQALHAVVGGKDTISIYANALNSVRMILTPLKESMPQRDYYNALTLLSDLNHSDIGAFEQYFSQFTTLQNPTIRKKVIFYGDPINPNYFAQLNAAGIYVSAFVPYEFFTMPCDKLDTYYFENPLFQTHLYMLVELRRLISTYSPDAVILNPGGIYLNESEADFYVYKLSQDLPVYKLPGTFNGVPIQL